MNNPSPWQVCALILAFYAASVAADPPYGDSFDAPDSFETAVLITVEDGVYEGHFDSSDDVDFYKFTVSRGGGAIRVNCWRVAGRSQLPCASMLLDPDQKPQAAYPNTWSYPCGCVWTSHHADNAEPGDWRLRVEAPGEPGTYRFTIVAEGAAAPAGGGGAIGETSLGVLLVLALARRRRRSTELERYS